LPVTIVRPSIIIANYDDPLQGWIDTLAASGGVILGISAGVMHFVRSSPTAIIDFIPCDFVSNQILVQTAFTAMDPTPNLNVIHSATTTRRPLTVPEVRVHILKYSKYTPWYQNLSRVWAYPIPSTKAWKFAVGVTETLPLTVGKLYANASGNEKLAKQLQMLSVISDKMYTMQTIFHHFIGNTWQFANSLSDRAWTAMSPEERKEFKIDVTIIDWNIAMRNHIFGLRRFYIHEDIVDPNDHQQLLQKTQIDWFHDLHVAYTASSNLKTRSIKTYYREIVSQQNFNAYVAYWTR